LTQLNLERNGISDTGKQYLEKLKTTRTDLTIKLE